MKKTPDEEQDDNFTSLRVDSDEGEEKKRSIMRKSK